jgi:transposase
MCLSTISYGYKPEEFMNNISKIYIGVDIGKRSLDINLYPLGKSFKIDNTACEIEKFVSGLNKFDVERIGCEATGGYEKLFVKILREHAKSVSIIDPRRIKAFITACGIKYKTDKIDAQKIAEFLSLNPSDYEPMQRSENESVMLALANRKEDLTKFLGIEKTRLKHPSHAPSIDSIKEHMKYLEKEIASIDHQIQVIIDQNDSLKRKSEILESIPGIGKATAAVLLATTPELGNLNQKEASALLGVCPYDRESGSYKGKKYIRGGRAFPRKMLYMCALSTIKFNLIFKDFYNNLRSKGKPFKVAIVAVMHKLVILANSLLKKGELCKV